MKIGDQDMDIRYGGRLVQLTVFINTDRTPEEIVLAVQEAARGQQKDLAVVLASLYESGPVSNQIWDEVIVATQKAHAASQTARSR